MSIPPRDVSIPLLTEVIDESDLGLAGPPAPPTLAGLSSEAFINEPPLLKDQTNEANSAPVQPQNPVEAIPPHAPPLRTSYATQSQSVQAYPLPLRPAVASHLPQMPGLRPGANSAIEPPLPPPAASDDEWQRMERRVRERILGQLLSRTDVMLEERIRSSLAGVLEQAVDGLAATLRANLHKTLEDVVSRAVAQEITRLQSSKNKDFS